MVEPICPKCSGDLKKDMKSALWICPKCRSTYVYVEPAPNDEQIELKNFSDRLAYCTDQAMLNIQELMRMITELNQQITHYSRKYDKIEFVLSEYERSYKLLRDSTQAAKELIENMEEWVTHVGGGYFEECTII